MRRHDHAMCVSSHTRSVFEWLRLAAMGYHFRKLNDAYGEN
jgi:hypothetical protein